MSERIRETLIDSVLRLIRPGAKAAFAPGIIHRMVI